MDLEKRSLLLMNQSNIYHTLVILSGSGVMNIPGGGSLNAVNISLMKENFIVDFSKKNFEKNSYRFKRARHVALGGCISQSAQCNGSHGFLIIVETSSYESSNMVSLLD